LNGLEFECFEEIEGSIGTQNMRSGSHYSVEIPAGRKRSASPSGLVASELEANARSGSGGGEGAKGFVAGSMAGGAVRGSKEWRRERL